MKFIPILFSTSMVQAIMDGRKTMTRRIVKPKPDDDSKPKLVPGNKSEEISMYYWDTTAGERVFKYCPYGQPGDVLWVRETFANLNDDFSDVPPYYVYKADLVEANNYGPVTWKPSLFMVKKACRIFLQITSIKVERLQDISESDAITEGVISQKWETLKSIRYKDYFADNSGYGHSDVDFPTVSTAHESFETLWKKINGPESWNTNPFVWVIKFERIQKPANFLN